ncbi:MAG: hypothetical protein ABID35_06335, partial [Candidatus Margulisiibacteriota bacterium]
MPEKAVVQIKDNTAYVAESRLKVLLDEDYLALRENTAQEKMDLEKISQDQAKALNRLSSSVVKEIIIPELEKEVNYGKNFAQLRQAYNALILAVWFKNKLKQHLVSQIYADKQKIKGIDLKDKQIKEKIYRQYLAAYKKGVYNYVKNDYDLSLQKVISRRYYGGGISLPKGDWIEEKEVNQFSNLNEQRQRYRESVALTSTQPHDEVLEAETHQASSTSSKGIEEPGVNWRKLFFILVAKLGLMLVDPSKIGDPKEEYLPTGSQVIQVSVAKEESDRKPLAGFDPERKQQLDKQASSSSSSLGPQEIYREWLAQAEARYKRPITKYRDRSFAATIGEKEQEGDLLFELRQRTYQKPTLSIQEIRDLAESFREMTAWANFFNPGYGKQEDSAYNQQVHKWLEFDLSVNADLEKFLAAAITMPVLNDYAVILLEQYLYRYSDQATDDRLIRMIRAVASSRRIIGSPLNPNLLDFLSQKYTSEREDFLTSLREDVDRSFSDKQYPRVAWGPVFSMQVEEALDRVTRLKGEPDVSSSSLTQKVNIFESKDLQKGILAAGEDGQQVFLPIRQISELSAPEKDRLANLLWGWIDDAEERGTPLSHQDRVYELYQALLLNMPYGQNSANSQQRLYFALSNGSPDGGWSAVEAIVEVTEGKRANGSGQPARAVTWLQNDQRQRQDALQGAAQQLLWWVANKESKQSPSLPLVFDIRPSAFGNTLSDDTKIQRLKPYNQQEVDIFLDQHSRYTLTKFKETGNGDLAGTIYREFEPALSSASSPAQQPVDIDNLIKIWDRINQDAQAPEVYDKSGVPVAQPITQTFEDRVRITQDVLRELYQEDVSEYALFVILAGIQGMSEREALRFLLDPSNPEIAELKSPYIDALNVYELFLISEIIGVDLEDLVNFIHDFYSQVFPTPDIFAFLELVDTPIDFAIGIPSLNTRIITLGTMATTLATGFIKYNESDPSKQENFSVNPPQEVNFSAVNGLRGWIPAQFVSEYLRAKGVKDMTFADFTADFADDSQEQRVAYDLLQKTSATPEQAKDVMLGLLLFFNAPCLIPEIDPLKAQDAGETDQASSSSASSPAQEVDRLEEIALHKGTRQAE